MEVDRVSQTGVVGRERVPGWPDPAKRRRKFAEELAGSGTEPDEDSGSSASGDQPDSQSAGESNTPDASTEADSSSGHVFDALA